MYLPIYTYLSQSLFILVSCHIAHFTVRGYFLDCTTELTSDESDDLDDEGVRSEPLRELFRGLELEPHSDVCPNEVSKRDLA